MNQIKTATLVARNMELKPGMHISLILYNGNDMHIAEEIHNYLSDCMYHDIPIPLDGTEFRLHIEDVEVQSDPDFGTLFHTRYKITLKGELI